MDGGGEAGHQVDFATPDGQRAFADPLMVSGEGLDPWAWVPRLRELRLVGFFLHPKTYGDLRVCDYCTLARSLTRY